MWRLIFLTLTGLALCFGLAGWWRGGRGLVVEMDVTPVEFGFLRVRNNCFEIEGSTRPRLAIAQFHTQSCRATDMGPMESQGRGSASGGSDFQGAWGRPNAAQKRLRVRNVLPASTTLA